MYSVSAQRYTDIYINDANKVALSWLNNINHNQYENAYNLCSKEYKAEKPKEIWIAYYSELMLEFGNLESRTVIQRYFQSQVEGMEDGFYVFVEYDCEYELTQEHKEIVVLKQNDQASWRIDSWEYQFVSQEEEGKTKE